MTTAPGLNALPVVSAPAGPDRDPPERYDLILFISGASASSTRAVTDVRTFCDLYLWGRHQLRIVDVYRDPGEATAHGVLGMPTLIKEHPLPRRVMVGDLSDPDQLLLNLSIDLAAGSPPGSEVARAPDET